MYKFRHRAVIRYLGLKGLTPKQVHLDMEATPGKDTPSYTMVKMWAGKFKRDRESLEDDPRPVRLNNARFCACFHFQGLEGLIICNRKTRNGYSFKLAVYSSIE